MKVPGAGCRVPGARNRALLALLAIVFAAHAAAAQTPRLSNGRIESQTFVGESYESEIRAGGELLLARIEPEARLASGDAVHFRLDPAHGLLVAR